MTEFFVPGPKEGYPSELKKTSKGRRRLEQSDERTRELADPQEATMEGVIQRTEEKVSE